MSQKRLNEIRNIRLDRVKKLRELGVDPYPSKVKGEITPVQKALKSKKEVGVAGRIWGWRVHGNVVFADIKDESGQLQLWFQKNNLKERFKILKLLDVGDFLYAKGKITKTKAGETTLDVSDFQLLTKSIRPIPSKWSGLKDIEERYRRRYLDILINPKVKEMFERKAKFWEANRKFMKDRGFIELETPILEHVTGGADAKPFVTHHNALDEDFYLRISTELYQKRLIGAGFQKVFVLGPNFRNEGIDDEHLQEYMQIEWYWAYTSYKEMMNMVKEMFRYLAKETFGKTKFKKGKHEFDLADEWEEIDYVEIIKDKFGVDVINDDVSKIKSTLNKEGVKLEGAVNKARLTDNLWKIIRKDISGPAFLINEPKFVSPLAKSKPDNPNITERFHIIIAGSELGNGYSELNDPVDQLKRFKKQQAARDAGDDEAQMLDVDYVEMLEYGMPPTSGYAHSERVFWFLEGVTAREGVLFPQMKRRSSNEKNLERKNRKCERSSRDL